MQPELNLFGLTLQTFGLMLGIAFLVCGWLTARYLKEIGKPVDWAYEFIFAAIVGGIVGSRLWWIAENWDEANDDLLGSLFSGAGLVFYGGALGGALCVLLWSRHKGFWEGRTLDMGAAPLAAGYAIGRIGCQLAGDGDYGIAWDGPWAMAYPNGTVPTDVPVHPTPVYETIVMGIVTRRAVALAAPVPAREPVRAVGGLRGHRALPGRVPAPQRGGRRRADPAPADLDRDDPGRRRLVRDPPRAGAGRGAGGRRRPIARTARQRA